MNTVLPNPTNADGQNLVISQFHLRTHPDTNQNIWIPQIKTDTPFPLKNSFVSGTPVAVKSLSKDDPPQNESKYQNQRQAESKLTFDPFYLDIERQVDDLDIRSLRSFVTRADSPTFETSPVVGFSTRPDFSPPPAPFFTTTKPLGRPLTLSFNSSHSFPQPPLRKDSGFDATESIPKLGMGVSPNSIVESGRNFSRKSSGGISKNSLSKNRTVSNIKNQHMRTTSQSRLLPLQSFPRLTLDKPSVSSPTTGVHEAHSPAQIVKLHYALLLLGFFLPPVWLLLGFGAKPDSRVLGKGQAAQSEDIRKKVQRVRLVAKVLGIGTFVGSLICIILTFCLI